MKAESPKEITQLLNEWSDGDELALEQLIPLVYRELHGMAKHYMQSQRVGHTLQTTALIHEAYLKLAKQEDRSWKNRAHFFGVAAQAIRHILVDYVRSRNFAKRGGDPQRVDLKEKMLVSNERAVALVDLDEALTRLAALDERKSKVVELKYFGGLTNDEIAVVLGISTKTVIRDWKFARSWLLDELQK